MASTWTVPGTLHETRAGGHQRRVFRVRWSSPRAVFADIGCQGYDLHVDRAALGDLLAAWCLAARSPHSLIWLPMRANRRPAEHELREIDRSMDLVLVRSSVQFPAHDWKRLRGSLGPGRRTRATVPSHEFPTVAEVWAQRHDQDVRDPIRFDEAANTVFVSGTRDAFGRQGAFLAQLAAEGPAEAVLHPKYPSHTELSAAWT